MPTPMRSPLPRGAARGSARDALSTMALGDLTAPTLPRVNSGAARLVPQSKLKMATGLDELFDGRRDHGGHTVEDDERDIDDEEEADAANIAACSGA